MTREELLANLPHNAQAPVTVLESVGGDYPELRVVDCEGHVWGTISGDTMWGRWHSAPDKALLEHFHADDWQQLCVDCFRPDPTVRRRMCGYAEEIDNREVPESVCDSCEKQHRDDI